MYLAFLEENKWLNGEVPVNKKKIIVQLPLFSEFIFFSDCYTIF